MIQDGEKTTLSLNNIITLDDDESLLSSLEYARSLENRNIILEGIIDAFNNQGINYTSDDIEIILKDLNARYKDMGIEEGLPKAVRNWINGTSSGADPNRARENMYNLCLALDLDIDKTKEFFLKYFMTIPFNLKNCSDFVYYYGISRHRNFKEIAALMEKVKELKGKSIPERVDATIFLGDDAELFEDDNEFLKYMEKHVYSEEYWFETAKKELEMLVESNATLLEEKYADEIQKRIEHAKDRIQKRDDEERVQRFKRPKDGKVNIKFLLEYIYGYSSQESYKKGQKTLSKNAVLPEKFRKNFPIDQFFSQIDKGELHTPEPIRKALVIMNFFNYFTQMGDEILSERCDNMNAIDDDYEDFIDETSGLLAKCGFVQMYARNPFDWLIMYCAKQEDPLDAFQRLMQST